MNFDREKKVFVLYSPSLVFKMRVFLTQYYIDGFDLLPLMHPLGYMQSIRYDYLNIFGQGGTAMFISSLKWQYYQLFANSLQHFLERQIYMIENRLYKIEQNGLISLFLNLETIYRDYINLQRENELQNIAQSQDISYINEEYPFTSCTVRHGLLFCIQAHFEIYESDPIPNNQYTRDHNIFSKLFFIIKFNIKTLDTFLKLQSQESHQYYELKKIILKIFPLDSENTNNNFQELLIKDFSNKKQKNKIFFTGEKESYELNKQLSVNQFDLRVQAQAEFEVVSNKQNNEGQSEVQQIPIHRSQLIVDLNHFKFSLPQGQQLVKNPFAHQFWDTYGDEDDDLYS